MSPPQSGLGALGTFTTVPAKDPPTLRLVDIAGLLNVSKERARQIANGEDYRFPAPAIMGPRRARSRDEVEAWIVEERWWGRYRWWKPAEPS